MWVWGLGFGVQSLGLGVWGWGDMGFEVLEFGGFRGLGIRV